MQSADDREFPPPAPDRDRETKARAAKPDSQTGRRVAPVRVFLVSDFCLLGKGLERLFGSESGRFDLAGIAEANEALLAAVLRAAPDIVLLDLDGGNANDAIDLIRTLHARSGALILLLSRLDDRTIRDEAILAGARGIIDRSTTPDMLFAAIEKVMAGQIWLDRETTGRLFVQMSRNTLPKEIDPVDTRIAQLTEREKAIVDRVLRHSEESGKTIAHQLHISESTLRNHLTSIYEKLGVKNRAGLLAYAFHNRLMDRLGQ